MVTKGYYQQLANYDEWDGKCQELVQNFVLETGFNEELVLTTFGCIVNGLSWESSISDFTQELDSRLQKLSLLRPSSRAPEEEWDSFLSKRIQWKIDPLEYGIKVKASVVTDKGQKTLNVYVELSNCNYQKVELNTTIFDVNGLIKGTDTLLYSKIVDKYEVAQSTFWLKCSVTKINKIVISGKIKQLLGNE